MNSKEANEHGFDTQYDYCCAEKAAGCFSDSSCPDFCTKKLNSRTRMSSPDAGFYLKWQFDDDGVPFGCDCFEQDDIAKKHTFHTYVYS